MDIIQIFHSFFKNFTEHQLITKHIIVRSDDSTKKNEPNMSIPNVKEKLNHPRLRKKLGQQIYDVRPCELFKAIKTK